MKQARMITIRVNKSEKDLLEEACLFGASADKNLKQAVPEGGKYRIAFSYDELDDLAGFVAACANHEESERKQERWDRLCEKIEDVLESCNEGTGSKIIPLPVPPVIMYVFDVSILKRRCEPSEKTVLRRIQIEGGSSLYEFAETITKAFNFYFDHCFGFYDNFQKYHDSKKMYELFVDIDEDPPPGSKSVEKTKIQQVFKKIGDEMMFLFDYGDGWRFRVQLKERMEVENREAKPKVLKKIGKAPLQYPQHEDI
ncbi:hypothetical protein ACFLQ8_00550 [Candidatus Auribacterota bacterium]